MNKLAPRLILTFILTVLISLAIALFITFQLIPHHISDEVKKGADQVAAAVEEKQLSTSDLEKQITDFSFLKLSYTTLSKINQSDAFTDASKKELLQGQSITAEKYDRVYLYIYPITIDGQINYLQLTLDQTMYKDILNRAFILLSCITIFIGVLLNIFTSFQIVRPIHRLTQLTKQFAKGNFTFPPYKKHAVEIDQLYESFGTMSNDLEKMLQSQKDFVSNISHEFQTPLTSINGFAKALQQKEMSRERQNYYLAIIDKESARLSLLSSNVLKLSNLQNNTKPLEKHSFDLAEQIRQVIISLETRWQSKNLTIELYLKKQVIFADELLLYQAWYNLINNAINFSPANSIITIRITDDSSNYTVVIEDQGPGIAPPELARVKEPFYKAKTLKSTGNGLGLSIVENIIQKHDGFFTLKNTEDGLAVTVSIPICKL